MSSYVIGVDFGTDSVRALLVNAHTGEEVATAVHSYKRWAEGLYCNPAHAQFRQHPLDYIEGLEASITQVLSQVSDTVKSGVVGISVDTTGSTPVAVDEKATPLALLPEFADNPNAMFILWKDHTANEEAREINELARTWEVDYTKYSGGLYSSEWFWSKILHTIRIDDAVAAKAYSWLEHCDWIPALLTGNTDPHSIKRGRCAAGHKAMWHEEFGGLPSDKFLSALDFRMKGLRSRLYTETYTSDHAAGTLSAEWSRRLGLSENVVVGVGAIDAHFGAVGAKIEPFHLVKVMGTSTCDMLIAPTSLFEGICIKGICGQVDGSIIPGMLAMEAGQSAYGDLFQWFSQLLSFPVRTLFGDTLPKGMIDKMIAQILPTLNDKAATLPVTASDAVALDWINGRRTPDVDLDMKCMISGIHLGTDAVSIYKTLVEATAFGSKAIVERYEEEGVTISKVIALGGLSKKAAFVMQTLANILELPIAVVKSEQACALGAAMFAATAAGVYPAIGDAQAAMHSGYEKEYYPEENKRAVYQELYKKYKDLGAFAKKNKHQKKTNATESVN
ncbi:ribulokinase [Flavisolibacter tropicus]|uniref:Ribulokinase n=1 Tax=Flavisolibacter tropicus TaxID=1492898 RepID=A0A172TVP5_9BACT|nr:ribulokinase [Flavisolibacter tropicus]ANE51056.1 ribulokinase [Flavisolibacter tropicus]